MPRFIALSLCLFIAACCGSPTISPTDPDPTEEPPTDAAAPPAPDEESPTEEAAPTPTPVVEASTDVAVFASEDGTCRWSRIQPGSEGPPELIASLPAACHDDIVLGPSPRGGKVVVTMGEGVFEVVHADHTVTTLEGLGSLRGDLEAVGYGPDGALIALAVDFSEPITDPDNGWVGYVVEGDRLALDEEEVQYAAATALCVRYRRTDTGWMPDAAEVAYLREGTSPPMCVRDGDGWNVPLLKVHQHGGHGSFALEPLPEARQDPTLAKLSVDEYVEWGRIQMEGAQYALPFIWLEGQIFQAPLLIARDGRWQAVEGLDKPGDLSLSWGPGTFIACSGDHAGVYATASGARLWTGSTPCPVWWPLSPDA
jgi:hypothetical protein